MRHEHTTKPTRHRRWRSLLAAMTVVAAAGCGSGGGEDEAAGACRWLTTTLADGSCSAVDPWASLGIWQSGQAALDAAVLNLAVGGDAVEVARRQAAQGFQPPGRSELPPWPLQLPLDWGADPFDDRNWQFQLNAWRMLDPLIVAWETTRAPGHLDEAMALVADWHRFHVVQGRHSSHGWNDMATGIRAMKLAWLADHALRGDFAVTPERGMLLIELAERHARKLREEDFLSDGNHGLFQLHGLLALCNTLPHLRSCPGGVAYAEGAMERLLGLQFTNEGVHREHSPEYHQFVADVLQTMLPSGWYDGFGFTRRLLPLVEANRVWMFHPDGRLVAVGDSIEGDRIQFPEGDASCAVPGTPASHCYRLQTFTETGYAIVRSDWAVPVADASMLFLMASFHTVGHKHADDLSFELFEFGERVLTDTGKYKYADDAWRAFATSVRAHNTLEVDDQPGTVLAMNAYGSGLRDARAQDGGFVLDAEAPRADSGRRHLRQIHYTPRRSLLVVDRLPGPAAPAVTQWFHFAPQVTVAADPSVAGRFQATLGNGRRIEIEPLRPGCSGTLHRGATAPVQGWTTVSYGALVPRQTLGLRCTGMQAGYATLFVLDPAHGDQARRDARRILQSLGL